MEYQRQKALEFAQFFETGMFVDLKIFCNDPINDDGDGEKESKFFNVHKVLILLTYFIEAIFVLTPISWTILLLKVNLTGVNPMLIETNQLRPCGPTEPNRFFGPNRL